MFYDQAGIETIVEKLINNRNNTNDVQCMTELVSLFDLTLQGSTMNHRYLLQELCEISKLIQKANSDKNSTVRRILIEQARHLVSSLKMMPTTMKNDCPKGRVVLPSRAITQRRDKDPVNGKFDELDLKAIKLNDFYHKLKTEDNTLRLMRPSVNEGFQRAYRSVRHNLASHIQTASQHEHEHQRELARCENQKKQFQQQITNKINPLQNKLTKNQERQNALIARKDQLEKELANINVKCLALALALSLHEG